MTDTIHVPAMPSLLEMPRDVCVERVKLKLFVGQRVAAVIVAGGLQDRQPFCP